MSYIAEDVIKKISIFAQWDPNQIADVIEKSMRYHLYKEDKYIDTSQYVTQGEDLPASIEALVVAITSLAKYTIPQKELKKYYLSLNSIIGENLTSKIDQYLQGNREKIIAALERCKMPSDALFTGMDWRLDLVLSTKLKEQVYKPTYLIKLESTDKSEIYQSDYCVMKKMYEELKQAKESLQSTYAKRVQRYAKFC